MREFSFDIEKSILMGLRRNSHNPINTGGLVEAQNFVVRRIGDQLIPQKYVPLTQPISSTELSNNGVIVAFPSPQLFRGKSRTFLMEPTKIWEVNDTSWLLYPQLTTYNADNPSTTKAITAGGIWHFVDFYDVFIFFNGTSTVFSSSANGMFGGTDKVFVNDSVVVKTGCEFKGRGVLGGFTTSSSFNSHWKNTIEEIKNDVGLGIDVNILSRYLGNNFVWWSSIGGGDLFMLFLPQLVEEGLITDHSHTLYDHTKPLWQDAIVKNQMGWMPMPWKGYVNVVKQLGDTVMVYGDGGIAALIPTGGTFGLRLISNVGVSDRGAVGGNIYKHAYVDDKGILWIVDGSLKPERIGCEEFFSSMGSMLVVYNEVDDEFYISDSAVSYTLAGALTKSTYLVTCCERLKYGNVIGFYSRPGGVGSTYLVLTTDKFDGGVRGVKTIERVSIESEDTQGISVAVDWRNSRADSFTTSPYIPVNYNGDAVVQVCGVEFRVRIRSTNYANTTPPTRVTVHWKFNDSRGQRSQHDFKVIP